MNNMENKMCKRVAVKRYSILILTAILVFFITSCEISEYIPTINTDTKQSFDIDSVPEFAGKAYVEIDNNKPHFSEEEINIKDGYESYSKLDKYGRCGVAFAKVGKATMPTEKRGSIGMIKPTGWHTIRYDNLIKDKYLYNRCHLIGYQLTGENANEKNLITGTRYLNVTGMLPFENEVAEYIENTNNNVLYRATPIFVGDELVARGVHLEAFSIEDNGKGISFNVYCYNNQPNIAIDYKTGESKALK